MKISAQIDKSILAMFEPGYKENLEKAREEISKGFKGAFPVIKKED